MTMEEAIRAITIDAAWQLGLEDKIGSIEVGKYADLVILEESPFDVPKENIKDVKVLATIMDGKYTYTIDQYSVYMQKQNLLALAAMPAALKGCDHGHGNHRH